MRNELRQCGVDSELSKRRQVESVVGAGGRAAYETMRPWKSHTISPSLRKTRRFDVDVAEDICTSDARSDGAMRCDAQSGAMTDEYCRVGK